MQGSIGRNYIFLFVSYLCDIFVNIQRCREASKERIYGLKSMCIHIQLHWRTYYKYFNIYGNFICYFLSNEYFNTDNSIFIYPIPLSFLNKIFTNVLNKHVLSSIVYVWNDIYDCNILHVA